MLKMVKSRFHSSISLYRYRTDRIWRTADLEMLLIELDINSPRPALDRGTPDHSTKRARLQLSATSFFVIRKQQEREGTYATEVYPESGF